MKRSKPLTRKSPLRRGTKTMRKSRLKKVSAKKWTWLDHYKDKKANTWKIERECADCGSPTFHDRLEPHHPAGRQGSNILRFVWICKGCHHRIHHEAKWARRTGRLLPEFEGRKSTKSTPNFFGV